MTRPQQLKLELLVVDEEGNPVEQTEQTVTIEFSEMHVRVIFGECEGDSPDVYLERRVEGFDIAIHPHPGDPEIVIESRGDGHRVFDTTLFQSREIAFIESDEYWLNKQADARATEMMAQDPGR